MKTQVWRAVFNKTNAYGKLFIICWISGLSAMIEKIKLFESFVGLWYYRQNLSFYFELLCWYTLHYGQLSPNAPSAFDPQHLWEMQKCLEMTTAIWNFIPQYRPIITMASQAITCCPQKMTVAAIDCNFKRFSATSLALLELICWSIAITRFSITVQNAIALSQQTCETFTSLSKSAHSI